MKKYQRSLDLSGPVVSEYTLKHRHPWWNAFKVISELEKKGKSIKRNLTPEIKMLAADAKRIITLQRFMPQSVQRKYKRDLSDPDRASDYLFEIRIAWHFYLRGSDLQWYEDDGKRHPEFMVKSDSLDFNVECKRISVDIARKIKRKDFHSLVQKLLPEIEKGRHCGRIDITLDGRLESNQIDGLVKEVLGLAKCGEIQGHRRISLGLVSLELHTKRRERVNVIEHYRRLRTNLPDATHGAVFSSARSGDYIVDPIQMGIRCQEPDNVLDGIYEKVYDAANGQLATSKAGVIICFLEDVHDLRDLSTDSGLQRMTCALLAKGRFSHIAGIGYSSEAQMHKLYNGEAYDNQSLFFKNPNCKFREVEAYNFISST
ncbi:MAG: hypothetical protein ACYS7Y_09000 [Planctomycetota bacterium]